MNAMKMSGVIERSDGRCDLLVSLQISLRLLLHAERDTFQSPRDLRRIRSLFESRGQCRHMPYGPVSPSKIREQWI